ncbi:MAG: aminotransferase class I/II-fold pyridoxal phosphate-dependent enzyme [Gemmatimonadota bacterium]
MIPVSHKVDLPRRLLALPGYPLAEVPAIKAKLRAAGTEIIDLGIGDPGLPVPGAAVTALQNAAADPALQGYGFQGGLPAFRLSIAGWLKRRFGAALDPETEILPVIGSKEAIALSAFALLDPGDDVLIPDPGYPPYFGGAHFAGATIHRAALRPEDGFLVPPDTIRSTGQRLRLVVLNYPNNPTGAVADREYLAEVIAACEERGATLLWDNAYSEIGFDGYSPTGLLEVEGGRDIGIEFHSFSKTYNMTGWRLGWACGSAPLIGALRRVKTFFDTGSYLAIQAAGAAVLQDPDEFIRGNVEALQARRDAAVEAFRRHGFAVASPRATLYLWTPVPTAETSEDFCRRVLEASGVVLMPGSALGPGGEGFIRASLTVAPELYEAAASRVARVI